MKSGIYAITSPSGRSYVGSSANITKRWWQHRKELTKGTHHCRALQFAASKYGVAKLTFSVLELCDIDKLLVREQHYFDSRAPRQLYNSTFTAGSLRGFKMPDGFRQRISEINKGRRRSSETKALMSHYSSNRSPEHLAKLASSLRGKSPTAETREKQAAAKRGKALTPEHVAKVREACLKSVRSDNTAGVRGVSKSGAKWSARITVQGKYKHIGRFDSIEAAAAAVAAHR